MPAGTSTFELFKQHISYLGHVVSEKGIHTDQTKIEVIKSLPVPKTVKLVSCFLCITGYHGKFI